MNSAENNLEPKDKKEEKNPWNDYIKYSGIAFQMLAVIGLSAWGGIKLDEKFNSSPLFIILLTFIGIFGSIYTLYKSLPKE